LRGGFAVGNRWKHRRHGTVVTAPEGVAPGTWFVKVGDHAEEGPVPEEEPVPEEDKPGKKGK
jgi:hypothetical protein